MQARVAEATTERDTAAVGLESANNAVEAAQRELAGAEAGDGRDESNRSLSERLRDAENAQARLQLKINQYSLLGRNSLLDFL